MNKYLLLLLITQLFVLGCKTGKTSNAIIDQYQYVSQKKIVSENGAVVSAHPLASKVGVAVLKMGGNAIDASNAN